MLPGQFRWLWGSLSSKLRKDKTVAVAYIGDGAVEEGVVHECLNFASVKKLPVIFMVENNLFASHMDLEDRQQSFSPRFAIANHIPYCIVDGNDVLSVSEAASASIKEQEMMTGQLLLKLLPIGGWDMLIGGKMWMLG